MISISLSNLTLILGAKTLFHGLSWEIHHDQKIGLVGPNGAGKSSLFKLIMGEFTAEPGGVIARARGITVGYMPQQPEFDPSAVAFQLALDGNPRVHELEQELADIESRLGDPFVYENEKALTRALELHENTLVEYESLGGASYPVRVRDLLCGLGLSEADFTKGLFPLGDCFCEEGEPNPEGLEGRTNWKIFCSELIELLRASCGLDIVVKKPLSD